MSIALKNSRWFKIILIVLLVLTLLVGGAYYIILFRFKETIAFIVKKETNNAYFFDASSINVSLIKADIRIKDAVLTCKDTLNVSSHYDVRIPAVYFKIESLRDILFKGKITVDSLAIDLPRFKVHEHSAEKRSHVSFHLSNILTGLQKASSRLKIRSFTLNNAAFNYGNRSQPANFNSDRINFSIKNFSDDTNNGAKFLSSDDIDLSISNQQWKLPDGKHELSFSKLHFSGKRQYFEIDSCTFAGKDEEDRPFSISIDRLFFNSSQLSAFYKKEELILDSLILFHPVVVIPPPKKDKPVKDTTQLISQSLKNIFKTINLKYIDIRDGHVELSRTDKPQQTFSPDGTDLKVYNLVIKDDSTHISTDSIVLTQKSIEFVTRDSLFKLTIGAFYLRGTDILLKDAAYGPTEINHNAKSITFKAPLLALHDVSVEDLIAKKLRAENAELVAPEIIFTNHYTTAGKVKKPLNEAGKAAARDKFYTTLHGISELIAVNNFRIRNGNLSYETTGKTPLKARMENLDMLILLNKFFLSDSLVDIKRSLPEVEIGKISLNSPRLNLGIHNFSFKGEYRHNHTDAFTLQLSKNSTLKGKDISWVIFDWDRFQNDQSIFINTIRVGELLVDLKQKVANDNRSVVSKPFPVLHIDRADVGKLYFRQPGKTSEVHFNGSGICMENVNSVKRMLNWTNAEAVVRDIVFNKPGIKAIINAINFNTDAQTELYNAQVDINPGKNSTKIKVPSIKLDMQLHSSDFSSLHFKSVGINNPQIEMLKQMVTTSHPKKEDATKKPLELTVDQFSINDAAIKYTDLSKPDSSIAGLHANINISGLLHNNMSPQLLSYSKATAGISNMAYTTKAITIGMPELTLESINGILSKKKNSIGFDSDVAMQWDDIEMRWKKDSNTVAVDHLSGSLTDEKFSFIPGTKMDWRSLANRIVLNGGNIHYQGKDIYAHVMGIRWQPSHQHFSTTVFTMAPRLNEEDFYKQKGWRADYITVNGSSMQFSGIQLNKHPGDSTISARKLLLNGVLLTTLKDKRFPLPLVPKEKQMFTYLINKIKYPINLDSIQLNDATIVVNEITETSHKKAVIPLENVNAVITHVRNKNNERDSLRIYANLKMFNIRLHQLNYHEAYADSLGSFRMRIRASAIQLPELSTLTMPYANVSIIGGKADTLFADWYGNKHAAAGNMHLYYDGLKIKLLSKKDSTKSGLIQRIEAALANDIALHKKNDKPSYIFYVRDKEKSIFNYWVKSLLNGAVGGAAIFQNKKHYKTYLKQRSQYKLPDIMPEGDDK